jgi:hypothetical protein
MIDVLGLEAHRWICVQRIDGVAVSHMEEV